MQRGQEWDVTCASDVKHKSPSGHRWANRWKPEARFWSLSIKYCTDHLKSEYTHWKWKMPQSMVRACLSAQPSQLTLLDCAQLWHASCSAVLFWMLNHPSAADPKDGTCSPCADVSWTGLWFQVTTNGIWWVLFPLGVTAAPTWVVSCYWNPVSRKTTTEWVQFFSLCDVKAGNRCHAIVWLLSWLLSNFSAVSEFPSNILEALHQIPEQGWFLQGETLRTQVQQEWQGTWDISYTSLRSGSVSGLEVSVVVEELSSSARVSFSSSSWDFPFARFSFSSCFFGGLALRCWRDFPFPGDGKSE